MVENKSYFPYHIHTEISNASGFMDSIAKPKDYTKLAKEYGIKALGITEHGNVFNWVTKKDLIEKEGLKYVHGVECYVTVDKTKKLRDNYHLVMLAKNLEGVKEINKLLTKSFNREDGSYYYDNRIELDDVIKTTDNIIITTACIGGILGSYREDVIDRFINFAKENKDRVFLEVQPNMALIQKQHNLKCLKLAREYGLKLIAGTDTHYANDEQRKARIVLQMSKGLKPDGSDNEWNMSFRSREELENEFEEQGVLSKEEYMEAIDNTNVVESMIKEFELDRNFKYPKLYEDNIKEFKSRIVKGAKRKDIKLDKEKLDRINMELKIYIDTGTIDYMLLESDIKDFCRQEGISVSYGRGSVTGSYIAYLLGIHQVDSIKNKLIFERFINPERVSLADIDTDYTEEARDKIKEYLYNKKGLHCSSIITFNTIAKKGSIKDVARAFGMDIGLANKITSSVEDDEITEEEASYRKQYPKLFEYSDLLMGTLVSIGVHPAGTIVSPTPLDEDISLCTVKGASEPVSALNMKEIDGLNYVKLDLLGLKTLEVIELTCKYAGIDFITPDFLDKVAFNDEKVWKSIGEESLLIFQMDSNTGRPYCKKLFSDETIEKIRGDNKEFKFIDLLAIANGAIRPAGASYRDSISNGDRHEFNFKPLDDFFSDTLGNCVFQEDLIRFLSEFCKMSLAEGDLVRRGLSKGLGTEQYIPQIRNGFMEYVKEKYNLDEETSENLIEYMLVIIKDASDYAFSRNHAIPYSYNGYACAWLRYYYPLEFFTAYMNVYLDKKDKLDDVMKYITRHTNVEVKQPLFRHSHWLYGYDKEENAIYEGIGKYNHMNEKIGKGMYELRDKEYKNFLELLIDLKEIGVNSRQLKILIVEDFFMKFGKSKKLLRIVDIFDALYNRKQFLLKKVDDLELSHKIFKKYSKPEPKKNYMEIDWHSIIVEHIDLIEDESVDIRTRVEFEKKQLNKVIAIYPELKENYYYVEDMNNKNGYMLVDFYNLKTGERESLWVNNVEELIRNKFETGNILNIIDRTQKGVKSWRVII